MSPLYAELSTGANSFDGDDAPAATVYFPAHEARSTVKTAWSFATNPKTADRGDQHSPSGLCSPHSKEPYDSQ